MSCAARLHAFADTARVLRDLQFFFVVVDCVCAVHDPVRELDADDDLNMDGITWRSH